VQHTAGAVSCFALKNRAVFRIRRTTTPILYFAEVFKRDKDEIQAVDALYEAPLETFYSVVAGLDNKHDAVALFAHNPGITAFANTLTEVRTDNMPTCSLFAVQADTDDWKTFRESSKKFLFFDYPKNPLGHLD
jgi:phosphohistidine phosphatase